MFGMKSVGVLALALVLAGTACGSSVQQFGSTLSGKPTEHRFDDGVRCFTYTQGSIACVVVK